MRTIILILICISISIVTFGQRVNSKLDFSLVFASCFDQDTLNLSINGVPIANDIILKSDFSTGLTQFATYQNNEALWLQIGKSQFKKEKIPLDKQLVIQINLNGKLTENKINLKKGKILIIDYCNTKTGHGNPLRIVTIRQNKKTVTFE